MIHSFHVFHNAITLQANLIYSPMVLYNHDYLINQRRYVILILISLNKKPC